MMSVHNARVSCKICMDTSEALRPGATIYGRVVCNLSTDQFVKEIKCKLFGREYTIIKSAKDTYETINEFLHIKMSLSGEGTLEPRVHEFPFCLKLPEDIPSTFVTEFGIIKYFIKATVNIPYSFDYTDEVALPVSVPVDFNNIPDLRLKTISLQKEKTICCLCCAGGEMSMHLQLEKNAFVVGEEAKIHLQVTNMTTIEIEEVILSLTKIINYESDGIRQETTKEVIATQTEFGVGAHEERAYLINFKIPLNVTVHSLVKCVLIKETFRLRAKVLLPLMHRDFKIDTYIKLGHIALGNATFQVSSHEDL